MWVWATIRHVTHAAPRRFFAAPIAAALIACGGSDPATPSGTTSTADTSSGPTTDTPDGSSSETTETTAPPETTSTSNPDTSSGSGPTTTGGEPGCGDRIVDDGEECDDGDTDVGDGCGATCTWEVTALALGSDHTCALRGPRVRCWGLGDGGRLGYGDTVTIGDDEPAGARGDLDLGGDAVQISAGGDHGCARLSDGSLVCWGGNAGGWLGYGNTDPVGDDETPAQIGPVDLGEPAIHVATGPSATCTLLESTALVCWGQGDFVGAGHGDTLGDDEVPAQIPAVDLGGIAGTVSVGHLHTCAAGDDGAWCWGQGVFGQLGYGNTDAIGDDEVPSSVGTVDVGASITQLALGNVHSCGRTDGGTVRCWGQSGFGQLGYGNPNAIGDDEAPASAGDVSLGGTATAIATGSVSSFALLDDGTVRAWGGNEGGQLGLGNTTNVGVVQDPSRVPPVDVGASVVAIAAGNDHTCVVTDHGTVRCWGLAFFGRLGYGDDEHIGDDEAPSSAGDVPVD